MAAAEPLCGAKHVCTHVGHVLKLSVANMHRVEDPVDISSPSPPGLPEPGMPDPRYYKNGFTPKMTKQPRLDASQLQVAYYSLLPARLSSVQVPTKSILRSEERSPRTLQWWDDDENDAPQRRKEERIAFVEQSGRWGEETHKTDVLCDVDDMQDVEVLAWLALDPHCFGLKSPNFRLLW